jgi:hypothetical protein
VDPKIRDFIEVAENQWDFTTPGSIPGFGEVSLEDARRLVRGVMGERESEPPVEPIAQSGDLEPRNDVVKLSDTADSEPPDDAAEVTLAEEKPQPDAATQHKEPLN